MAITIKEKAKSRSFVVNESLQLEFFATGSADHDAIADALTAHLESISLIESSWNLSNPVIEDVFIDEDNPAGCFWSIEVEYTSPDISTPAQLATGETARSFDITSKNEKLRYDLESTVYQSSAPKTPPIPTPSAINWDGKKVNGIDVPVPFGTYSIRKKFRKTQITQAYLIAAFTMIGKINSAKFEGFKPGELLFKGVSGNQPTDASDWDLTFHWDVEMSRAAFTIESIAIPEKRGWDYMEFIPGKKLEDSQIKPKLKSVAIRKIFKEVDFAGLKI
jgi:hypothetical protein